MSVGGTIIDLVELEPSRWWVNTYDGRDTCAVYVDPLGERMEVGDGLWWQAGHALWTPRVHPDGRADVRLVKLSSSGVTHPDVALSAYQASQLNPWKEESK